MMNPTRAITSGVLGTLHMLVSADVIEAVPQLSSMIPTEIDVAGLFTASAPTIIVAITGMHLIFEATNGYLRKIEEADDALLKKLAAKN